MTDPFTREFCKGRKIIFHPVSEDEAKTIQEYLFGMGFAWQNSGQKVCHLDELVKGSLSLENGVITFDASGRQTDGIICTVAQFDPDYIGDDRKFLVSLFDKLARRLDRIEARMDGMEKDIAALRAEILPAEMDKPKLPKPGA